MQRVEHASLDVRMVKIAELRQAAHQLLARETRTSLRTLIKHALDALDNGEGWLKKQRVTALPPLLTLVDFEICTAEGRLSLVMDLLEHYGNDTSWSD